MTAPALLLDSRDFAPYSPPAASARQKQRLKPSRPYRPCP